MENNSELLIRDEKVFALVEESEIISLQRAVGELAMSIYLNMRERNNTGDFDKKKELETEIRFQSKVLNSLSNAYFALNR